MSGGGTLLTLKVNILMGKDVSCTIRKCSCSWKQFSFPVPHKIFVFLSEHPKGGNLAEENCKVQAREQMLTQLKISVDQALWCYLSHDRNERLRSIGIKGAVKYEN